MAASFLVFGDLHGRILPAFRLASAWSREQGVKLEGLLQVGDLGFFPWPERMDKATRRHAEKDVLELGACEVFEPSRRADAIFAEAECPPGLWFTLGNHEDYQTLDQLKHRGTPTAFPVDAYDRVHCIRDGRVVALTGGVRVGALWGIDDQAPNARRKTPPELRIKPRSAAQLGAETFDVLLAHESPRDAIFPDSGSEEITLLLHLARPAFAFFGHYSGTGRQIPTRGATQIYHLSGFELRGKGDTAEEGSVGLLTWSDGVGEFTYLDAHWLRTFTRHNWLSR